MSDCFNHEADAWDDALSGQTYEEGLDCQGWTNSYAYRGTYSSAQRSQPLPTKPKKVKCQYCGKKKLRWAKTSSGWRLVTKKKKLHVCSEYKKLRTAH